MNPVTDSAVAALLTEGQTEGRITPAMVGECLNLLTGPSTPAARARVRQIFDQCREPPADPTRVGFVRIELEGRRPTAAAVECWSDLLHEVIDAMDVEPDAKEAAYLADLDAMKLVPHGNFMNAELASMGSDARGWIGFVTTATELVRSADVFRTVEQSGEWCRSIIEREGGRQ